ncbi:MAG: tetratricopeptide repeat protein [Candidatus Hydrogenedentes bacterium]|nr:tetratricopeptide repeat protein [Candidatus Hydrogenedentota bacterium]
MDAGSAQASFKQAGELYRAGQFTQALQLIDELAQAFPDDKNILYSRARCLAAAGRIEDAQGVCARLVLDFEDTRAEQLLETMAPTQPTGGRRGPAHRPGRSRLVWGGAAALLILVLGGLAAGRLLHSSAETPEPTGVDTARASPAPPPAVTDPVDPQTQPAKPAVVEFRGSWVFTNATVGADGFSTLWVFRVSSAPPNWRDCRYFGYYGAELPDEYGEISAETFAGVRGKPTETVSIDHPSGPGTMEVVILSSPEPIQ